MKKTFFVRVTLMGKKDDKRIGIIKRTVLFLVLTMFVFVGSASAEYPEKPITILVGVLGGSTDLLSRAVAKEAQKLLGQPVVVEFKGGGKSAFLAALAGAKPDGYTLAASPDALSIMAPQLEKVPFQPLKFTPIIGLGMVQQTALVVKSDAPWKTAKEFIEYAKMNPGKIKYTPGMTGTGMHIAMKVIEKEERIQWVAVPIAQPPAAITALLGGHLHAGSVASGLWEEHVKAGTLRALLTHGEVRSPDTPNVPTMKELGYDYVNKTVMYMMGPSGLPSDIIKKLETAFEKAKKSQEFSKTLNTFKLESVNYDSKKLNLYLRQHWTQTENTLKYIGLIEKVATQPE